MSLPDANCTPDSKAARDWFIPLSEQDLTLRQAAELLRDVGLQQREIPLIVQLAENPKFELAGVTLFKGATDLQTHDYIHFLLGRGLLAKDEAFVLGFTMGSTKRLGALEAEIYGLLTRFVYPRDYRFSREDLEAFRDAVRLGHISACQPLDEVDYSSLLDQPLRQARDAIGLECDLLRAYYRIERKRYPHAPESQRLLQKPHHPD